VLRCPSCGAKRNINRATSQRGAENLPTCRGRHPHLGTFGSVPNGPWCSWSAPPTSGSLRACPRWPCRRSVPSRYRPRSSSYGMTCRTYGNPQCWISPGLCRRSRPCTSGARKKCSRRSPGTTRHWSRDRNRIREPIPTCARL